MKAERSADEGPARWIEFDEFQLDTRARVLWRSGRVVALPPKVLDTLIALLRRPGEVVLKRDLMAEVWPDTAVEQTSLAHNIYVLRKTFGAAGRYITTVPKRGYRFTGHVRPLTPGHFGDATILGRRDAATQAIARESKAVVLAWCPSCERHVWTASLEEALASTGTSAEMLIHLVDQGVVHYTQRVPGRLSLCMPSFIEALAVPDRR